MKPLLTLLLLTSCAHAEAYTPKQAELLGETVSRTLFKKECDETVVPAIKCVNSVLSQDKDTCSWSCVSMGSAPDLTGLNKDWNYGGTLKIETKYLGFTEQGDPFWVSKSEICGKK